MDVPLHLIFGSLIQRASSIKYIWIVPCIMSHYFVDKLGFWDEFPLWFKLEFVGVDFAQLIITLLLGSIVFVFMRKYWLGMVLSIVTWDIPGYFLFRFGKYFSMSNCWGCINKVPYHQFVNNLINVEPVTSIYVGLFIGIIVFSIIGIKTDSVQGVK